MLERVFRWCLRITMLVIILAVFASILFTIAILVIAIVRLINPEVLPSLRLTQDLVSAIIGIDIVGIFISFGLWAVDFFEPTY